MPTGSGSLKLMVLDMSYSEIGTYSAPVDLAKILTCDRSPSWIVLEMGQVLSFNALETSQRDDVTQVARHHGFSSDSSHEIVTQVLFVALQI